jgi:hypothetical protein
MVRMVLIETNDSCKPYCEFGGVLDLPDGITPDDMPRLYRQYWAEEPDDRSFTDWLIRCHGVTETESSYAIVGVDDLEEACP